MSDIAFVGLGNMGTPMSRKLLEAGHRIAGYDLSRDSLDTLAARGGRAFDTLAAAVAGADVVITMLPAGKHVRAVYEGDNGVLANARPDALLIDCSTIDVDTSRAVHKTAAGAGFEMVDAPVSGAVPAAEKGTLTFMVGGTEQAYRRALAALEPMGKLFVHVGAAGAGQAMKICNNMMAGISMVGVSEVFALAERFGLDTQKVYDVVTKSSGNCWALQMYCPVPGPVPASPANRDYAAGFSLAMMLKDMRLSQGAASSTGASTPLAASAAALYQMAANAGYGDKDFSVIFKLIAGGDMADGGKCLP